MQPISLKIKGIYSYQTEQTIDFNDLTAAGLFGIFGKVGSGKSSIVEAITTVLYGKNDRLDGDFFRYNLLNLKSNEAFIIFELIYEQAHYKFEARWKRSTKNYEDVKGKQYIYKMVDGQWESIDETAESILGLSYEHFKRTTIIPQGKFREFIELTPTKRTNMIKDIFDLYRFDLKAKIKDKFDATQAQMHTLDGSINTYADVNAADIPVLTQKIAAHKSALKDIEIKIEQTNIALKEQNNAKEKYHAKQQLELEAQSLKQNWSSFQEKKQKLNTYINIHQGFKSLMDQHVQLQAKINQTTQEWEKCLSNIHALAQQENSIRTELVHAEQKYNLIESKKQQLQDFDQITAIIKLQQQIDHLAIRKEAGYAHIKDKMAKRQELEQLATRLEAELAALHSSKLNIPAIQNLDNWFLHANQIMLNQQQHEKTLSSIIKNQAPFATILASIGWDNPNYAENFDAQKQTILANLDILKKEEQRLLVASELSIYAHNLTDGEPCLLCGATSHPNKLDEANAQEHLTQIKSKLIEQEAALKNIEAQERNVAAAKTQFDFFEEQKLKVESAIAVLAKEQETHEATFPTEYYARPDKEMYEADKQFFVQNEQAKLKIQETIQANKNAYEKVLNDLKVYEDTLHDFDLQIATSEATKKVHFQNIKSINGAYYVKEGLQTVLEQQNLLNNQIQEATKAYEHIVAQATLLKEQIHIEKGQEKALNAQVASLKQGYQDVASQLDTALEAIDITTLQEVTEILNWNIPTATWQKEIDEFFYKFDHNAQQLASINVLLKVINYDESLFNKLTADINLLLSNQKEIIASVSSTQTQLDQLTRRHKELTELQTEHAKVNNRLEHLKELRTLFIGDAFIEFVSGTYLKQLCDYANLRFHRLTRNQLSLSINDKTEFEIIDYLNGGKSRSIKTLSGGQAFQASLCLALALAESVQAKSQQDKHFFFIDEGFGTQDKDTIPMIFETLQSIKNENRIVGIITHVEELQENIVKSLVITKDEIDGSTIEQY